MATLLENYKGKSDGSVLTAVEWNNCMTAIEGGIEAAKSGVGTDNTGVLYTDDGSTVLQSTSKNTNLVADKNVQVKSKKGKFIYDTTSTVANDGDNEILIITKVKDPVLSKGYQADDHGDEIHEMRRFRIKPFDTPKPSDNTKKTEGFLALDTSGLEDSRNTDEEEFEIRAYTTNVADSEVTLTKTQYRNTVLKSRGFEARCVEAGGVALQPCGFDHHSDPVFDPGHHFENKIKFESARVKPITEGYHEDDSVADKSAYVKDGKWIKGGKGIEFATFNNAHTSIFTKDYRYNLDGIVRAVTRGNLIESPTTGKIDYPTLSDDFKDIISTDPHNNATVRSITKTAHSFNGGKDRHTKITNSNNLEIQTNSTYHWVLATEPTGEDVEVITLGGTDASCSDVNHIYNDADFKDAEIPKYNEGVVYKINDEYYTLEKIKSPELKLHSESDLSLNASDDVVLNANDCVKLESPEIRLTASDFISLSTTPNIVALTTKITAKGKQELVETKLVSGILNNMDRTIYTNSSTGQIKIPTDFSVFYTAANTEYIPTPTSKKTPVFSNSEATETPEEGIYYVKVEDSIYVVEIENDSVKGICAKKEPKNCSDTVTNPGYANVTFVEKTYTGEEGFVELEPLSVASNSESCNIADIIKLVNWMKTNEQGPWSGIVNA